MNAPPSKPVNEWTIDVCASCGALAVYPFSCGHRPEPGEPDGARSWTIPVVVRPRYPGEYRGTMLREARLRREAAVR